ncbi:hypothetical protein AB0L99_02890 [Streptomyces sp. NPDC051954]|uniref:Rv1733c family protein n=1 Tax=Streptomyces sp. NPDC051954 TaxID=3155524 RepID=UPI003418EAEC
MAFRGPKVWLWRWRRNPLKRQADMVEAWVLLGAWVITLLVGVCAGLAVNRSVEHGLARERVEWRPAAARLTEQAAGQALANSGAVSGERVWGKVRWTAPDGSVHTGQARVRTGSAVGTTVKVWTDRKGRLVTRPATASQARSQAAMTGALMGVGAAAVPFVCGRFLHGRLERRRMEMWDAEWALLGPLWGRTTG